MNRYDAVSVREKDGKSYFTRIGVAFPAKTGNGFTVLLDAMPAPVDGQFKVLLMEPKQRTEDAPSQSYAAAKPRAGVPAFDADDNIPF